MGTDARDCVFSKENKLTFVFPASMEQDVVTVPRDSLTLKHACPTCRQGFPDPISLIQHLDEKSCARQRRPSVSGSGADTARQEAAAAELIQDEEKIDSDLAELESLTSSVTLMAASKSVQQGTIMSEDVCKSCAEIFDEAEHIRKTCSNCLADFCITCVRMVKLGSYGEKNARPMCFNCVEEVKQKIMKWRAVGRGTGRATPPLSGPNSPAASPKVPPFVGTGVGRGRTRSASIGGGRGTGFATSGTGFSK